LHPQPLLDATMHLGFPPPPPLSLPSPPSLAVACRGFQGIGKYCVLPIWRVIAATGRAVRDYILKPIWLALVWVVKGVVRAFVWVSGCGLKVVWRLPSRTARAQHPQPE
jgi:hypothetical protein